MTRHEIRVLSCARKIGALEYDLAIQILNNRQFRRVPSSIDKHHIEEGGNLRHTCEVVLIALDMAKSIIALKKQVDLSIVFSAALLHDYGKIDTYECVGMSWRKVCPYTKESHITSGIDYARELLTGWYPKKTAAIVHCIGAHHGRKDYGALWEPNTPEAWIVHLADMASVFGIEGRRAGS